LKSNPHEGNLQVNRIHPNRLTRPADDLLKNGVIGSSRPIALATL